MPAQGAERRAEPSPIPRATVVVPVHNGERTLGRCLASLAQRPLLPDWVEIIVVDDGSTDGTGEIACAHGARVIRHTARSGAAAARNSGALWARGPILLFIDADCEAAPGWAAAMLGPFEDPGVSAVYGAYRSRQSGLVARFAQAEFDERYARLGGRTHIDFLATHAAAVRRDVFERLGGFRTDLEQNEDVDMAFRLSRAGHRVVFAPQAAVYHEHPSTLARYLGTKVARGYWRTLVYARHPAKAVQDDYTPPWLKAQVAGIVALALSAVVALVSPLSWPLPLCVLAGLVATTVPTLRFVGRTQRGLLWASPWLSLARSGALAVGVLGGLGAILAGRLRSPDR